MTTAKIALALAARRQPNSRRLVCTLIAAHLLLNIAVFATAALPKPQTTDSLLSQAAELQKARDFAGAEKLYRQALVDAPDDPEILKALAVVCQAEGKFAESIEIFQSILKRAPLYPGVNGLVGASYYALNDFEKTIDAMKKELAGNPKDPQARHLLALAQSSSGHLFEAIQELEGLLADYPNDAPVLYQLVVDYRAAAQKNGEKLAKLYPDSEYLHAINAEVYEDSERFDDAIREFKEVLRKDPKFPGLHFALGQAYWRKNDMQNAQEQLRLALQEEPNHALAAYYLADILTNQKNYREAIPLLQMVTPAYPALKEAYFLLGKCYAGTGEDQRALEAFNKALQLNPNYKEVHYRLYILYSHLGDKKNSAAQLRIFEELVKKGQEEEEFRRRETLQRQTKTGSQDN